MLDMSSRSNFQYMKSLSGFNDFEEKDAIDSYFECVTACSIEEDGVECFSHCVEIHLKGNSD